MSSDTTAIESTKALGVLVSSNARIEVLATGAGTRKKLKVEDVRAGRRKLADYFGRPRKK